MHRCVISLKYKSFFSRKNARQFAITGMTKTENKALLNKVLSLKSDKFEWFNEPICLNSSRSTVKIIGKYSRPDLGLLL